MLGFDTLGRYVELMKRTFSKPDNWKMFWRQLPKEMVKLGIDSIGIIVLISIFMGAIMTMQTVLNTENPLLPRYSTGLVLRDTMLLEFASSIMSLLLAGKVGSNIASEIGTMRITEQIDALDIMGINSANYLILPKVIGLVLCMPVLVTFSVFFGLIGGAGVAYFTDLIPVADFVYGIQYAFIPYYFTYSIIKSLFFGFIIASISAFYGYYAYGGALNVGKASTNAVVNSSIFILLMNIVLTKLLLV
ncbi:MAG TPA: ABC transporter permease [Paludibacteraceae bacterium]|nr:ABC transporter permease [Paludibacteraceae bacterium]HQB68882.1 ABC transporter permease [Paludibacteraceae bacterium]HRS67148.1 ABC transporter permease [Paludibacteraceae bacterium]